MRVPRVLEMRFTSYINMIPSCGAAASAASQLIVEIHDVIAMRSGMRCSGRVTRGSRGSSRAVAICSAVRATRRRLDPVERACPASLVARDCQFYIDVYRKRESRAFARAKPPPRCDVARSEILLPTQIDVGDRRNRSRWRAREAPNRTAYRFGDTQTRSGTRACARARSYDDSVYTYIFSIGGARPVRWQSRSSFSLRAF